MKYTRVGHLTASNVWRHHVRRAVVCDSAPVQ